MDATSLKRAASQATDGVEVVAANDEESLKAHLSCDSLLLVNRELDGPFRVARGIDLIKALAGESPAPRMMLICNFPEAQQQAQAAAALPGFGKTDAHSDATAKKLAEGVRGAT